MKLTPDLHFIRKHILRVLIYTDWAKFSQMRPEKIDSNLYNYHLKQLVKEGFVEHDSDHGYKLSPIGMRFVDHVSIKTFEPRWQPKLLTMLVVLNNNHIWLWPKYRQPFIGSWSLPSGKVHYDDESLEQAALREASYLSSKPPRSIRHCGVIEFSADINSQVVSHTISHVFVVDIDPGDVTHPRTKLIDIDALDDIQLSPGTREIITEVMSAASDKDKGFFYKSITIDWGSLPG